MKDMIEEWRSEIYSSGAVPALPARLPLQSATARLHTWLGQLPQPLRTDTLLWSLLIVNGRGQRVPPSSGMQRALIKNIMDVLESPELLLLRWGETAGGSSEPPPAYLVVLPRQGVLPRAAWGSSEPPPAYLRMPVLGEPPWPRNCWHPFYAIIALRETTSRVTRWPEKEWLIQTLFFIWSCAPVFEVRYDLPTYISSRGGWLPELIEAFHKASLAGTRIPPLRQTLHMLQRTAGQHQPPCPEFAAAMVGSGFRCTDRDRLNSIVRAGHSTREIFEHARAELLLG